MKEYISPAGIFVRTPHLPNLTLAGNFFVPTVTYAGETHYGNVHGFTGGAWVRFVDPQGCVSPGIWAKALKEVFSANIADSS
jgi:hypothetical protein